MLKHKAYKFLSDEVRTIYRALLKISVVFFLLATATANAQKLSGHFLISTPKLKQSFEKFIVQKRPLVGVLEKPISFQALIPMAVNNIQYNLDWQSLKFDPIADHSIRFSILQPQLDIIVPQLEIDTYLVQIVNGVVIKLRVQSTCNEIRLVTNTESISVNAEISGSLKSNHVKMSANITELDLGTPQLTVQNFKCSNVAGIESIIADELLKQFNQMDFYKPILSEKLNQLLAVQLQQYALKAENAIKDQVMSVEGLSAPLFSLLQVNENYIDIGFSLNNPDVKFKNLNGYTMNSDGVLVVDKTELQEYLKQSLSDRLIKLSYSSKDIPELDKLTRSRFKQFFVWPGLRKLPKGQELILRPMFESINFALKPNSYVNSLNITATAGLWIMARNEPMVYLRSNLQAATKLEATAQVKTTIQSLQSSSIWDQNFLTNYKPSKRISTGIIDSTAEKFFNNHWATANLSVFKLTNTASGSLKKIFYSSDNKLYFELGLNN